MSTSEGTETNEATKGDDDSAEISPFTDRAFSRRDFARWGGIAAASGVGLAIGSTILGSEPAAAEGPYVTLGNNDLTTNAASAGTWVNNPSVETNFDIPTANLAGLYGIAPGPSGIIDTLLQPSTGGSGSTGVPAGVIGDGNNAAGLAACGVIGLSSDYGDGSNAPRIGPGVLGVSQAISGYYNVAESAAGVVGDSSVNPGVVGVSAGTYGVYGFSAVSPSVFGTDSGIGTGAGVVGEIGNAKNGSPAVSGYTAGKGAGVKGEAISAGGTGVLATNTKGTALAVKGVATFSRSGQASIPEGDNSVTVTGVSLKSSSLVLATLQGAALGVGVETVTQLTTDSFEVVLTGSVPTGMTATVGWFVVN
jgi:hypothetical protein